MNWRGVAGSGDPGKARSLVNSSRKHDCVHPLVWVGLWCCWWEPGDPSTSGLPPCLMGRGIRLNRPQHHFELVPGTFLGNYLGRRSRFPDTWRVTCLPLPHATHTLNLFSPEMISEATDMKEAMETMPEMLLYGIINANVLPFLKNVICQVTVDKGRDLSIL